MSNFNAFELDGFNGFIDSGFHARGEAIRRLWYLGLLGEGGSLDSVNVNTFAPSVVRSFNAGTELAGIRHNHALRVDDRSNLYIHGPIFRNRDPTFAWKYDAQGKLLWEYKTSEPINAFDPLPQSGSFIVEGNVVKRMSDDGDVIGEVDVGPYMDVAWATNTAYSKWSAAPDGSIFIGGQAASAESAILIKITPNDQIEWMLSPNDLEDMGVSNGGQLTRMYTLRSDADGSVIIAPRVGRFGLTSLAKLDNAGRVEWSHSPLITDGRGRQIQSMEVVNRAGGFVTYDRGSRTFIRHDSGGNAVAHYHLDNWDTTVNIDVMAGVPDGTALLRRNEFYNGTTHWVIDHVDENLNVIMFRRLPVAMLGVAADPGQITLKPSVWV